MSLSSRNLWRCLDVVILVGLLVFASVALAAEQKPGGAITGNVRAVKSDAAPTPTPLAKAKVVAEPGGYAAETNGRGQFTLNLPPGVYDVTFTADGFEPFTQKVLAPAAAPASIAAVLFPTAEEPPVPNIKRTGPGGPVSYGSSVTLDISGSTGIARDGIRWEIVGPDGKVVNNPYARPARPLQLEASAVPGSPPLSYTFAPPTPGTYKVRVLLKNKLSGDSEKAAEVVVVATNAPPEALPVVIAGPGMPQKTPDGRPKQGTGLKTVTVGDKVFLAGWALDKNVPTPELYNAEGRKADTYGKNDDWAMRQFGWHWKLEWIDGGGNRSDETTQLKTNGKEKPAESEFPWFVAEKPGEYVATLVADDRDPGGSLSSAPQGVVIKVLPKENALASEATCTATNGCHGKFTTSRTAADALVGGHTCQGCHGPGQAHLAAADAAEKAKTMESPAMPGLCGRCHQEYGEWEKARHSDAYPFGYNEIPPPLLLNCAKCHYAKGFAEVTATSQAQKVPFGEIEFKKEAFPGGPKVVFDFTKLPKKMGESVSCQSCHDVHQVTKQNPQGLRMPKSELCGTCHEEKWQNVLLERTAGKVGSSYEYPDEAYGSTNPHNTGDKCALCHMSKASEKKDQNGVRLLGGHTMRMRDAGADGRVGGFGPAPDDPTALREQFSKDDMLNMAVCQRCHPGATSYDINGRQTEIYKLWNQLGKLLKERNSGLLPGYKPGDKCATCHRGGTLPFDKDPHMVLENAYTNYKLIMNDRSWGVHNYKYSKKLLEDSIKAVEANYPLN